MCRSPRRRALPRLAPSVTLLLVLLALAPLPATALDVEPYGFIALADGGTSFSTGIACIQITGVECPTSASTEEGDDDAWGLGAAVRVSGPWWIDLRGSRQDTEARFFDASGDPVSTPAAAFEVTHLHVGVLYRFLDGRWSPFATAFGGISRLDSSASTPQGAAIDLDRPSGGLGAGVLVDLGSRLGLRFELRGSRTDLPGDFDEDLEQVEGSVGLRLRL